MQRLWFHYVPFVIVISVVIFHPKVMDNFDALIFHSVLPIDDSVSQCIFKISIDFAGPFLQSDIIFFLFLFS